MPKLIWLMRDSTADMVDSNFHLENQLFNVSGQNELFDLSEIKKNLSILFHDRECLSLDVPLAEGDSNARIVYGSESKRASDFCNIDKIISLNIKIFMFNILLTK